MKTFIATYIYAMLTALIATPVVIRIAKKFRVINQPNARTIHTGIIPRIGGIAIFIAAMLPTITVLFLPNFIGASFRQMQQQITVLLACGAAMFLVGLWDDLKGMRARTKLAWQLLIAVAFCWFGDLINSLRIADWLTINFGWFAWPLTIVWLVGITNAVNLIDGLDGLAAGICAITCFVIMVLSIYFGIAIMAIIALAMLGALSGFLFYNFNPARIFMGDCGSLFLGFTIAAASVLCIDKSSALIGLALPILALGIPIFDTLFSMLHRFVTRRSMFAADKSHFHHRLLGYGLNQRHVVLVAYTVTIMAAGLGMFMMVARDMQTLMIFACLLILIMLLFRAIGAVRLRKTIEDLQRKYYIDRQTKEDVHTFEQLELNFSQVACFNTWWDSVCQVAEKMSFTKVTLPLVQRNGEHKMLIWQRDRNLSSERDTMKMNLPVGDRRAGQKLEIELIVSVNGSLEAAAHRGALFARLMEEHGLHVLPSQKPAISDISGETTAV